mmetsp:Transcript_20355/g.65563  ORF Transcript_20355/g.65563 Transcript_20355/m.65563 type:complete len:95 (-) Transcript_20355:49-333(-)
MDDEDQHCLVFDAFRRLLFLAPAKDGRNNVAHTLLVEAADCEKHTKTKSKLKQTYGVVDPIVAYLLVVRKNRLRDTLYGRVRDTYEKLGKQSLA